MALLQRFFLFLMLMGAAQAQYAPVENTYIIKNFKFHTGEILPEMKVHYVTLGNPKGEPVLLLHGTTGIGNNMLAKPFADNLYGAGQALDASKYFLIMPTAIGAGGSSKPSDGMRAKFPRYNYDDVVDAHYQLVKEGLGLNRLRLILGNSMGGMNVWVWGVRYPNFADALVPMASTPAAMSGRNWMTRRMMIDAVRNDPAWKNGDYTEQPPQIRAASFWFGIATAFGNQGLHAKGSDRVKADKWLDEQYAAFKVGDANDALYRWDSSRDYDPSKDLEKITAHVLVLNSADDERNPPELGLMEPALKRIKNAKIYLVPSSSDTSGHLTVGNSKFYAKQLGEFLAEVPVRK